MENKLARTIALTLSLGFTSLLFAPQVSAMTQQEYNQLRQAQAIRDAVRAKQQLEQQITDQYAKGLNAFKARSYQECIYYLTNDRVANMFGNKKDYHIALGLSYRELKNYNKALAHLIHANKMGANNFPVMTGISYSFMDIQNYQQAYPYLQRTTSLFPNEPDPYWNLGITCDNLKNEACVLASMQKITEIRPTYSPDPYYYVGVIYNNHKQYANSLANYNKGIQYFPQNGEMYYQAGHTCFLDGNWQGSIPYFNKSIKFQPNNLDAYYEMGSSYVNLNDLDNSAAACQAMSKLAPKDSRTVDLCKVVNEKIMQRQLEQQQQMDQINQDIQNQQEIAQQASAMDATTMPNAAMGI